MLNGALAATQLHHKSAKRTKIFFVRFVFFVVQKNFHGHYSFLGYYLLALRRKILHAGSTAPAFYFLK